MLTRLKEGFASADEFVANVLRREKLLAAREKMDAILIEAIDSGSAMPMTAADWARIRSAGLRKARRLRKK